MFENASRSIPIDDDIHRFSYDLSSVSRPDKFDFCKRAFNMLYGPITLEVEDRRDIHALARGVRIGAGSIFHTDVSPMAVERTSTNLSQMEDESYSLLFNIAGRSMSKWGGSDLRDRHEGVITFQCNNQRFSGEVYTRSGYKLLSIRYPKSALATLIGRAPPASAVMIESQPHAAAIRSLTHLLKQRLFKGSPAEIKALYQASLALNAALMACDPDFIPAAAGQLQGVRAGLLTLLKRYIDINLLSPSLSLGAAAHHCGISVRYVQMLFETEQTTFKRYVLQRRLDRLYDHLRDPRRRDLSIADIAAQIGLQDRAALHRAFKERFGLTPGLLRKAPPILVIGS